MKPNNTKWIILAGVAGVFGFFIGPRILGSVSGGSGLLILLVLFAGLVGFIIYSLGGNKVGKAATPAMLADARTMAAAPGKGRIYVVRRGFMGGLAGMKVDIRGVAAGQVRMNQFVMAEVLPGTYEIETAMARNGMKPSNSESTVTVAEGEIVVVQAMLEMRATHAMTVQIPLSPNEGRIEIGNAKMAQWTS